VTVLVTGGAGYIGSHTVLALRAAGMPVVVLDNLSAGQAFLVPRDVPLVKGSIGDRPLVAETLNSYKVKSVIHFAASIAVGESVEKPLDYYTNNVANSLRLIKACVSHGVRRFVFSSTAAVYGQPEAVPVGEDAPLAPINPYGASKLMVESILRDVAAAHRLRYAALRYFNVAGADPEGRAGQATPSATHLLKIACEAALGRRPEVAIFGTDYPTRDGTCIRDYIHVSDLADIHVLAVRKLEDTGDSFVANCGYGYGYSVREVLAAVQRQGNGRLTVREAPRRPGDPAALVAGTERLRDLLGWEPRHDDLDEIVGTALAWERRLPSLRLATAGDIDQPEP
jgi:UDP-glucose 4-epimerase